MNLDKYDCYTDETFAVFRFESIGPKGIIQKVVNYQRMRTSPNGITVFNLSFGDWNEKKQRLDDSVTSNNLDRDKILATVDRLYWLLSIVMVCAPFMPRAVQPLKHDYIKWVSMLTGVK